MLTIDQLMTCIFTGQLKNKLLANEVHFLNLALLRELQLN